MFPKNDAIFDLISDMLIVINDQHRILRLNLTTRQRLGFLDGDLLEQPITLILNPKTDLTVKQTQHTDLMDVHGNLVPIELRVAPFTLGETKGLVLVAKDLSEQEASAELLRTAFNNSGTSLSISRISDGVFLDVNPTFLDTYGYTRQEVIGKTSNQLNLLADPTQRDLLIVETMKSNHIRDLDMRVRTKDGRILDALFNVDLLMIHGEACVMTSAIDITRRKEAESRLVDMLKDLEGLVSRKVNELNEAQLATIIALSNLTESRDTDTGHHVERIRDLATVLCESLAHDPAYTSILTSETIPVLASASILHDIGKVGIPDAILLKPAKLTPDEFEIMKQHVIIGWSMLEKLSQRFPDNRYLQLGKDIVLNHHERWDGKGYPHGLKGPAIPLAGQVIALCDVYDALRSKRPYKAPLDHPTAVDLILAQRATQFNPDVVDAFLAVEHYFEETYASLAE
jgi:PAS domain S-box-containing protein